jgi:hypothetical protein
LAACSSASFTNFSARAAFFAAAFAFFASIFAANSSGVNLASLINELTLSLTCAPLEIQDSSLSRSMRSLSSFPLALGLKKPSLSINAPSLGRRSSATVIK